MTAVLPRFPAAKQRSEVSVKILKGPVHLLENRSIHFPASLAQAFLPQLPRHPIKPTVVVIPGVCPKIPGKGKGALVQLRA